MRSLKVFQEKDGATLPSIGFAEIEPGPVAAGSVRLKMRYAGICGTDRHFLKGGSGVPCAIPQEGLVFGHEGVGEVAQCGLGVSNCKAGDIVVFESLWSCGQCEVCRRGNSNQCPHGQLLGTQRDGVFAEYADLSARLLYVINNQILAREQTKGLACVEPAACAVLACQNGRMSRQDSVVVFGGGPIGIFCAMISRVLFGVSRVYLVEPNERRRVLAEKWTTTVYSTAGDFKNEVDVVIEASGDLQNIESIFHLMKPNGRIVLMGRSPQPLRVNSVGHMITNAISIMGSRGHLGGAFSLVLKLFGEGKLPLGEVVTDVQEFGKLPQLLNDEEFERKYCKVLISFHDDG